MNSKNWNDRADKDLFFTILSVKNIGVISGAEWTTIGNHMRGLGYGFTNEGCRLVPPIFTTQPDRDARVSRLLVGFGLSTAVSFICIMLYWHLTTCIRGKS